MEAPTKLKRNIGLLALILYGVGTMVGGGFYALLGKVAAYSGTSLPISLTLAGFIALINGFSFAELSSRYPVSAGESRYVWEGFKIRFLSQLTGLLVVITGVVSAATLSVATVGFLDDMVSVNETLGIFLTVFFLGGVAAWGVSQSVLLVVIITIIEVGTLVVIIFLNFNNLNSDPINLIDISSFSSFDPLIGIFSGTFLAFYAFIGFEDMVNMAEEIKEPERNLAIAIPLCVIITTILYVLVAVVAISSTSIENLVQSRTPMAALVGDLGPLGLIGVGIVSMLTGINGALVQIVMSSRVSYGMAKQGQAPKWLENINPSTQTPLYATALVTFVVLLLALFFPLTVLAQATSSLILIVFSLVNLSLLRIKAVDPDWQGQGPRYSKWIPLLALCLCVGVLLFQLTLLVAR